MNLELYFAPGACSFVPHAGLESIKAATGEPFEPKLVKLHKGEQRTPEYLAMNPSAGGRGGCGQGTNRARHLQRLGGRR
jgi:glutathione S-transferase